MKSPANAPSRGISPSQSSSHPTHHVTLERLARPAGLMLDGSPLRENGSIAALSPGLPRRSFDRIEDLNDAHFPLSTPIWDALTPQFGHDFSRARVPTGEVAESAARIDAPAYAHCHSIDRQPASRPDPLPISAVQPESGTMLRVSRPLDAHEREADRFAELVMGMEAPARRGGALPPRALEGTMATDGIVPPERALMFRQADGESEEPRSDAELAAGDEPVMLAVESDDVLPEADDEGARKTEAQAGTGDFRNEPTDSATPLMRKAAFHAGRSDDSVVGASFDAQLRATSGAGASLPNEARSFFEPRFGFDFSSVRIHTDPRAARMSQQIEALAFTSGRDIYFGAGQYAPNSPSGRRLLAHELVHVVQQRQSSGAVLHRQQAAKKPAPPESTYLFNIKVENVMARDEAAVVALEQIFGINEARARELLAFMMERKLLKEDYPGFSEADVKAGISKTLVYVSAYNRLAARLGRTVGDDQSPEARKAAAAREARFEKLPSAEQDKINAEADRRFWARTRYKPGQKLGESQEDQAQGKLWKEIRDEMLRQQQAVEEIPEEIRGFLLGEGTGATIDPRDYDTVLRLATKVAALTPAERDEYKSRVTAKSTDWRELEASLERFLAERKEREAAAAERRNIETRLYRLEELYHRYRAYLSMVTNNATLAGMGSPEAAGASLGAQSTIEKMRSELEADLVRAGLPGGIAELEKLIHDYEAVFERETLALAKVMLDQYAHVLWQEEQRYQNGTVTDALYKAVHETKAAEDYARADQIRSEHATSIVLSPDEMADQAYWVGQRNQALDAGDEKVRSLRGAHPLLGNPDFDRERLARAPQSEVRAIMLDYIAARELDIEKTRKNLADKPTMIYGLDELLKASYLAQNVKPGSIYASIIQDHITDVHWSDAIPQMILAVIAIAAGLLTGGGGTVAVLAGGTAFGIGAYQAHEEFRRYEMKVAAKGAQLTSDDPSMAWVIVAVIGAGIDAAAFASVLPKLRPALEAFNVGAEAGDVAALEAKLGKLADIHQEIRSNPALMKAIMRAADAEVEARAAWKAVPRPAPVLFSQIVPYGDMFGRFVFAVYLSAVKRGIRELQLFARTNEAIEVIGDVAKLSLEELAQLKTAYQQAVREMETVAAHGKTLGLAEEEILSFMRLRGNTKGMTLEQLTKEMDAWKATAQGGLPARPLETTSLIVDENVMVALNKEAAGKALQPGEVALLARLRGHDVSDLRVSGTIYGKGAATLEPFNITVARNSAEYQGVLKELERFSVGRAKGAEDRQIVCDAFFAKVSPGVKPTLVTHDKGIYNRLLLITGRDPAKLGKPVPEIFPAGFDVTVQSRTILVLPLPGS